MAFDGITVAALCRELQNALTGGRISRIIQPESDALLLTVKSDSGQYRLYLSADASLPLAYLTDQNMAAPADAGAFCMLLRKHLNGGRIVSVEQPGLERVLVITVEHRDEMGDLVRRKLITELMGKHSNIILCTEEDNILDAVKRIPFHISSVREVLPGRTWFIPQTQNKTDPLALTEDTFLEKVTERPDHLSHAIVGALTGMSTQMAEEICFRAGLDGGTACSALDRTAGVHLAHTFLRVMEDVRSGCFSPAVWYRGDAPEQFSAMQMTMYGDMTCRPFTSVSSMLVSFYSEKERVTRIRQKSADLRHVVQTALERASKKLQLQEKQMRDTEKRDKYRIYGELLNTYGYSLEPGARSMEAVNYYDGTNVTVPLDPQLSAQENAKKYFDRYSKLKRTAEALEEHIRATQDDIEHLESISASLDLALNEADLAGIREELTESGYLRRHTEKGKKKKTPPAEPLHFVSSEGFDIYVGKNNYQNEDVSFRIAAPSDWWFHAKGMPGSHVIVRTEGRELPDSAYEEAARLAAYYSRGRLAPKVEIDYTLKKNLRKPAGARPGFVVYYTNYSMIAEPDITGIRQV